MRKRVSLVPQLIGLCIFLLIALSALLTATRADESVTAACYAGNRSVGSVVVFSVSDAARACNSLYYDCRGGCVGCVYDYDYVRNVCSDVSGRTFLRP